MSKIRPNSVFISYCHEDGKWVWERLVPCLRASEVDYHIDRERFKAGRAILGQMDDTQDRCHRHVLVLSPGYLASRYCCHELKRAVAIDPQFKNGHVIPIMRMKCTLPTGLAKPNPLYVDMREDHDDSQWKLLFGGLNADLRASASHWLEALGDVCRHLRRGESVNLVVKGKPRWRELITELQSTHFPDLVAVDLQSPATATRSGLIGQILQACGSRSPVPDEPRDLPHFGQIIEGRPLTTLAAHAFRSRCGSAALRSRLLRFPAVPDDGEKEARAPDTIERLLDESVANRLSIVGHRYQNCGTKRHTVKDDMLPVAKTLRVFISSTSEDLKKHREAACDAAIAAGMLPAMMEYFVASGDKPPLAACLNKVSEADVLVVLVAIATAGCRPINQQINTAASRGWTANGPWPKARKCSPFWSTKNTPGRKKSRSLPLDGGDAERFSQRGIVPRSQSECGLVEGVQGLAQRPRHPCHLHHAGRSPASVSEALLDCRRRHPDFEPAMPLAPPPADPTPYLNDLLAKTSFIDIRGFHASRGRASRFPIGELFISLCTTLSTAPVDDVNQDHGQRRQARDETELGTPESLAVPLHVALENDRLVVLGDPGAGKTTLLRRIAHALCQTRLSDQTDAVQFRLGITDRTFPIFVRLSDLAQHIQRHTGRDTAPSSDDAPTWLPHYLATASTDNSWGLEAGFFRHMLESAQCTVLLDGLDEPPDRIGRAELSRLIENATRTYKGCRFVVTSRPAVYIGEVILPEFGHARIDPLSDEAVEEFVSRWCAALLVERQEAVEAHHGELLEALRGQPAITCMIRNPMMLTAVVVLHWDGLRLPEQRAELYESIIHWLSRSREVRLGGPGPKRRWFCYRSWHWRCRMTGRDARRRFPYVGPQGRSPPK